MSFILGSTIPDMVIALAYFSIPILLVVFVRKNAKDLPWQFLCVGVLFALFIASCGIGHMMESLDFRHVDRCVGTARCGVKVVTAIISLATAGYMVYFVPHVIKVIDNHIVALRRARVAAEDANTAKSLFMAFICHEIRNPLFVITTMLDFIEETHLSKKQGHYLSSISEAVGLMLRLVNDVLDISKLDSVNSFALEKVDFDMQLLLDRLKETWQVHADSKDVDFVVHVSSDVPQYVSADCTRLLQVLYNLLSNAFKFTEEGTVTLTVTTSPEPLALMASPKASHYTIVGSNDDEAPGRPQKPTTTWVDFTVRDTGIGISPAQMRTLFEPYSQAKLSTTREYGGTGLGLCVVKGVVERMGGQVKVTSKLGRGSAFHVRVLLKQAVAIDHAETQRMTAELRIAKNVLPTSWGNSAEVLEDSSSDESSDFSLSVRGLVVGPHDPKYVAGTQSSAVCKLPHDSPSLSRRFMARKASLSPEAKNVIPSVERLQRSLDGETSIEPKTDTASVPDGVDSAGTGEAQANDIAKAPTRQRRRKRPKKKDESLAGFRVLVVDDNLVNRRMIKRMLVNMTADVTLAENGVQAITQVESSQFHVVLMDMQMPVMDGVTATKKLRKLGYTLPIIALTANALHQEEQKCLAAGMDYFATKPIRQAELKALLISILIH